MADKEFTQICKEILGIGKRLEKIEPDELRKIKADIEKISELVAANKTLFDTDKKDFDGKYNKIAEIIKTFDTLKAQIEEALKSGTINDSTEALVSTFSSKKIMDLLNEAKSVIDEKFSTIHKNGIIPWSSTLEYPAGAISVLNGKLYQAKTQNTNKKPSENKEIWHVVASEEWCEQTFLKKDDKIDAYAKKESDKKFALKDDLPPLATEAKAGIVKIKNSITGNLSDTAVSEKAVSDHFSSKFACSKNPIGYTKLSNGLILQWGKVLEVPADTRKKAIFPIAFPTACLNASVTYEAVLGAAAVEHGGMACLANISPSQMDVEYQALTANYVYQPTATIYWFAIGY